MEIAGQALETGVPAVPVTNAMSQAQPVSFAKGLGEDEMALARLAASVVAPGDVAVAVSASGGTGFVFEALRMARAKGALAVAITENADTPLGKAADVVVKSEAKPEGPSSGPVQAAHLAIGHAFVLALADERGVTADESISWMLPEPTRGNKKMGIK
jgi:D-arabinose 5-phosphate isomerase GutQ